MFKRIVVLMLAALLLFPHAAPALAQDTEQDYTAGELNLRAMVQENGTFYFLSSVQEGTEAVYICQPGMEPELLLTLPPMTPGLLYGKTYAELDADEKAEMDASVSSLFIKDGQLHALNHYTGAFGPVTSQGIDWQDKRLDVAVYQGGGGMQTLGQPFCQDGLLVMPLEPLSYTDGLDGIRVAISHLGTGATRVLETERVLAVAPYLPGQLLALNAHRLDDASSVWQFAAMDMETGSLSPLPMILFEAQPYNGPGAIGYDQGTDSYFYALPQRLMVSQAQQPFQLAALLPFDYVDTQNTQAFALPGGKVGILQGTLAIRSLESRVDTANTLTLQAPMLQREAVAAFRASHPHVTIFSDNRSLRASQAAALIQGGEEQIAIFTVAADDGLRAMVDKGYALPLTNEQLLQESATFYPLVQQVINNPAGQPSAWPINLHWSSWQVDKRAWQQYTGDTPLPATYLDILKAMLAFSQHEDLSAPEVHFLSEMPQEVFVMQVLQAFIRQHEEQDAPLHFDHPDLREALGLLSDIQALQAAAKYEPQQILGTNTADEDIMPALLYPFAGGGDLFGLPREEGVRFEDLPALPFSAGGTPTIPSQLYVAVVNPKSPQAALAQEFLWALSQKDINPRVYYALRPEQNEPYPNPNYEQTVARLEENLKATKERLGKAKAEGATALSMQENEDLVRYLEHKLADKEALRYMISKEGLANYRSKTAYISLPDRSLLLGSLLVETQLQPVIQRFVAGTLSAEHMVQELNQLSRLVYQESR